MRRFCFLLLWAGGLIFTMALATLAQSNRETPVVRVVGQAGPVVVNIYTRQPAERLFRGFGDPRLEQLFQDFFQPLARERSNLGTGVIIDGAQGLVITNRHVVAAAGEIKVQLIDRRIFDAEVVGADVNSDLAVLRISADQALPQAVLGDSEQIMIGEPVVAIGNPYGLSHTVTVGVVSALGRRLSSGGEHKTGGLIQTDAGINPGNSGGPLLNLDGELIGINTAIYQDAQGIGFALPINRARLVVEALLKDGRVHPAWLGLKVQDFSPALAQAFQLEPGLNGVLVSEVTAQGPAALAGVQAGDLLMAVSSEPLSSPQEFAVFLQDIPAGQKVGLDLKRREQSLLVEAVSRPFPKQLRVDLAWQRLGLAVEALDEAKARALRINPHSAVVINKIRPDSLAESVGLKPGDLVRQLGDLPVTGPDVFLEALVQYHLFPQIRVLIQRRNVSQYLNL